MKKYKEKKRGNFIKAYIAVILCALLFFVGCDGTIYSWQFEKEYTQVQEIQLIDIRGKEKQIVKELDISVAEELYNDIKAIEYKRYGPSLDSHYRMCIKIIFNNNEYDIISQIEPKHYRYEEGKIVGRNTWLECEQEKFDEVINKYLNL